MEGMSDRQSELRAAFEATGYEVASVNTNRSRYRVELLGQESGAEVRSIASETLDDDLVGLDVSTESVEGADGVRTVLSFRHVG